MNLRIGCRLTALSLGLVLTFTAPAGEKLGNSGDVRRLRSHRSTQIIERVLFLIRWGSILPGAEGKWLGEQDFVMRFLSTEVIWVDHQDPGTSDVCSVYIDDGNGGGQIRLSYTGCQVRTDREYFVREIARALFSVYRPTLNLDRIVDTFMIGIRRERDRMYAELEGTAKEYRTPIPEADLTHPSKMKVHFEKAREVALKELEIKISEEHEAGRLQPRYIEDIKSQTAIWTANQPSCSETLPRAGAPLTFSLSHCREIKYVEDLAWLMLHEAGHHLGIVDETKADSLSFYFINHAWIELFGTE